MVAFPKALRHEGWRALQQVHIRGLGGVLGGVFQMGQGQPLEERGKPQLAGVDCCPVNNTAAAWSALLPSGAQRHYLFPRDPSPAPHSCLDSAL